MSKEHSRVGEDNSQDWMRYSRSLPMLGKVGLERLKYSHVLVAGLGGVGGFALEVLCRAGIGTFSICDFDIVEISNINRQLHALSSTMGLPKTKVAEKRIKDINPEAEVRILNFKIDEFSIENIVFSSLDYVVDAVDDIEAKLLLIRGAKTAGIPVISCMGTGGKTNPLRFRIADIESSHTCPLAKAVRKRAKARGIGNFKVVFSDEKPVKEHADAMVNGDDKIISSLSFVPAAAGIIMGGEVVRDIALRCNE